MDKLLLFSVLFCCIFGEFYASEETKMSETTSETNKFIPTDEWQIIPEGNNHVWQYKMCKSN